MSHSFDDRMKAIALMQRTADEKAKVAKTEAEKQAEADDATKLSAAARWSTIGRPLLGTAVDRANEALAPVGLSIHMEDINTPRPIYLANLAVVFLKKNERSPKRLSLSVNLFGVIRYTYHSHTNDISKETDVFKVVDTTMGDIVAEFIEHAMAGRAT